MTTHIPIKSRRDQQIVTWSHKGDCWVVKRAYINANIHMDRVVAELLCSVEKKSGNRKMLVSYSTYDNSRKMQIIQDREQTTIAYW